MNGADRHGMGGNDAAVGLLWMWMCDSSSMITLFVSQRDLKPSSTPHQTMYV